MLPITVGFRRVSDMEIEPLDVQDYLQLKSERAGRVMAGGARLKSGTVLPTGTWRCNGGCLVFDGPAVQRMSEKA